MNPLLPADLPRAGSRAIPDTEEFLSSIGHMAARDELLALAPGVELGERDFVDPSLVFEDDGECERE